MVEEYIVVEYANNCSKQYILLWLSKDFLLKTYFYTIFNANRVRAQ